jgi:hypothetical protein
MLSEVLKLLRELMMSQDFQGYAAFGTTLTFKDLLTMNKGA